MKHENFLTRQEQYKRAIKNVLESDGTAWVEMGETNDGKKLCLVVGWGEGYDEDATLYQQLEGNTLWTLCGKLAFNVSALQCDYGWDWYMPYAENGEVYDTDTAITGDEVFEYWEDEAKDIIKRVNRGVLKCA